MPINICKGELKMANELDERTGPTAAEGRDVNVIDKQIPVKVGFGSLLFEIMLWVFLIIPGVIFLVKKIRAKNYFQQLQQRLQANASTIDNYMEQKVLILEQAVVIAAKSVEVDKEILTAVAAYRGGQRPATDGERNEMATQLNRVQVAFEAYPDIKSHAVLADLMQKNNYLNREITAARELYNDTVYEWNENVHKWPVKQIVAARAGYTTRVPFIASAEMKQKARTVINF